jgi:hypothetical protein
MRSTFLHDDQAIPPDERVDRYAPVCDPCKTRMWLTRIHTTLTDIAARSQRDYECKLCGAKKRVESDDSLDDVMRDCPL